MSRSTGPIYFILAFLILLIIGASYLILTYISDLRSEIKNLQLALQLPTTEKTTNRVAEAELKEVEIKKVPSPQPKKEVEVRQKDSISIQTGIIFETQSSPILLPQTPVTITIENVEKTSDGLVNVHLKAFTKDAASYSALEPRDLFELVNLEGANQKPLRVEGEFSSIPPKSAVTGNVQFRIDPTRTIIILQVRIGENLKFYEFNFSKETYKEVVIG